MEPPPARRIAGTAYFTGRRRPHFGFHEARRRGPSRHRRGSDRDGGGHALHGLTRLDYRAPDNGRGPRRILLECADPTGRARGIGTASTFGTPSTGSTGYAARAPRLVRNGSWAAVRQLAHLLQHCLSKQTLYRPYWWGSLVPRPDVLPSPQRPQSAPLPTGDRGAVLGSTQHWTGKA